MMYLLLLPPVIFGGIFDLRYGIIPNYLTLSLIVSGFLLNMITGDIVMSLVGFIIAFIAGYIAFALGGMGGGDVKLIAGIGAWIGLYPLIVILLFSSLIGLLWFAMRSLRKKSAFKSIYNFLISLYLSKATGLRTFISQNFEKEGTIPFGACIAIGYIITILLIKANYISILP